MSKYAIYAGHGGSDPGAVNGDMYEKNFTLAVANRLSDLLRQDGHAVIQNRTTDANRSITADANRANAENVDAVIELHLNSNAGTPATGTETLHSIHGGMSQTLAQEIQNRIVAAFGYANRGIKTRKNGYGKDYYGIIRQTQAPCVLVEMCFINNNADMDKWNTEKMAIAIRDGIYAAMGGTVTPSKPPTPPVNNAPKPANAPVGRVAELQAWLNTHYNSGLKADNAFGPATLKAATKAIQTIIGVAADGIWGQKSKAACRALRFGDSGNLVYLLQGLLYCRGSIYAGFNGQFTEMVKSEVMAYQGAKKLTKDGIAGKDTFTSLLVG